MSEEKKTFTNLRPWWGICEEETVNIRWRGKDKVHHTRKKHAKLPIFGTLEVGCGRKGRECWNVLLSSALFCSTLYSTFQVTDMHSGQQLFLPFVSCRFWHPQEPNLPEERCASIVYWTPLKWGWNNVFCDNKYYSICEMRKIYIWARLFINIFKVQTHQETIASWHVHLTVAILFLATPLYSWWNEFFLLLMVRVLSTWQERVTWAVESSAKELLPSAWPVSKSMGHFLD